MSDNRHSNPLVRRAQRVLLMVHELHKLGHQRLRISSGLAPNGCDWCCSVTHAGNILKLHGAMPKDFDLDSTNYSTVQSNNYFNWKDAQEDNARQLAAKFVERFPDIVEKGQGIDWQYAGWYVQMLGLTDPGILPVAYGNWYEALNLPWLPITGGPASDFPMPPGGEAEPEGASTSILFYERPTSWGFRGDPYLWMDMEKTLSHVEMPQDAEELRRLLESTFEQLVGVPLSYTKIVIVERYAHGGMTSGGVCTEYWRRDAFPLLISRFESTLRPRGRA